MAEDSAPTELEDFCGLISTNISRLRRWPAQLHTHFKFHLVLRNRLASESPCPIFNSFAIQMPEIILTGGAAFSDFPKFAAICQDAATPLVKRSWKC